MKPNVSWRADHPALRWARVTPERFVRRGRPWPYFYSALPPSASA